MWEDDFSKFMFTWDIPTFALRVSAATKYAIDNHSSINAKRQAAIYEYQTADRYANTTKQNTYDSQNTLKNNTKAIAATDYTNVLESSNTELANINRSATCERNIANLQNVQEEYNWDKSWRYKQNLKDINAQTMYRQTLVDQAMITAGEQATTQGAALGAATSGISQLVGGALSLGASGGGIAAAANMAGSTFSAVSNGISTLIGIGITHDYALNQKTAAGTKCSILTGLGNTPTVDPNAWNANNRIYLEDKEYTGFIKTKSIETRFDATDVDPGIVNYETAKNIANGEALYEVTNPGTSSAVPVGVIPVNAGRTKGTIDTNADNTYNTETNNADWTRDANWQAANANLILRQLQAEAPFNDGRLRKPDFVGGYNGNAYPDVWENRGVQWKIRTQSKSAIAQAGDGMLRYGYTVHRVWDIEDKDFCKMDKFTFWKAEDIWITNNDKTADKVSDVLMRAFLDGVTVWTNPDEIGSVSIYNNPVREVI